MKNGVCGAGPECNRSGQSVRIIARGLCQTCYSRGRSSGTLPVKSRPSRPWTTDDVNCLVSARKRGVLYRVIAAKLRRSLTGTRLKARQLGLWKPDGQAHGRGGPSHEKQMARVAFIDRTGHYPNRFGEPGKPVAKWYMKDKANYETLRERKDVSRADPQ